MREVKEKRIMLSITWITPVPFSAVKYRPAPVPSIEASKRSVPVLCALHFCVFIPLAPSLAPEATVFSHSFTQYISPAYPTSLAPRPPAPVHARPRGCAPAVRAARCFRAQGKGRLGQVMRSIARIHLALHVPWEN